MKRIALIRNSKSYDFGGAEIFPVNLANEVKKYGYVPIILSANRKTLSAARDSNIKVTESPWLSFQNFSGPRILLFCLYILWQLYLTIWYVIFGLKNRVAIFHPQSRDDFIAATLGAKLLGKKVIWTDHADLKYIYQNHRVWYKNPVGKLVYAASKLADHIVLISFSEKGLIEDALGHTVPDKYMVIHLGVVDSYTPLKHKPDKLVFISTSRLVQAKGIGELIEAFKSLDDNKSILKICGNGPDAAHFKKIARNNKNIDFVGHVENIPKALQGADILVHPSYHEGFGLSLVEAAMCGLPVIACRVGSVPEIIQDGVNGILVPPRSSEDLAAAMNALAKNQKLRTKMGQAGRKIYLKSFQFDKIVKEKFLPLYEEL